VATNELGHHLARDLAGDVTTLGAYRRGNRLPWLPDATIDTWVPCARGEVATGVPQPHVYFIQTIGGRSAADGSIYCPECRIEVAARRASGAVPVPLRVAPPRPSASVSAPPTTSDEQQAALPF
jgi:hypothetical protein